VPQPDRPPHRSPLEILKDAPAWRELIHDFVPVAEGLEWRLADAHWLANGVASFVDGSVPFSVNNDGRLSADSAAVFFAHCLQQPPGEQEISVLEVGAGTGLFARYFLDEFHALCRSAARDFYDRLTYNVTDRSPATVEFWATNQVFARHAGHVRMGVADADAPTIGMDRPLRAFFCNYILDTLPSSTVRRAADGWEQLCVRTWIDHHPDRLCQYTSLSLAEIRQRAAAGDLSALLSLPPLLEGERAFLPLPGDAFAALDPDSALPGQVFAFNHGAVRCLNAVIANLEPAGFIILNDYGATRQEDAARFVSGQWFGPASAMGLDFSLLARTLLRACPDLQIESPPGDDDLRIHARLIHRAAPPECRRVFLDRFSAEASERSAALTAEARAAAQSGDRAKALRCFHAAVDSNPRNWLLIGEAAVFAREQLHEYSRAIELAKTALELNPSYSSWLWNVLGESLTSAGRHDEAHDSHLQAERVHPDDPATQCHLAGSWLRRGDPARSLHAVARGLAGDTTSTHRHVLLERQQEAIRRLALRWEREWQASARRQETSLPRS